MAIIMYNMKYYSIAIIKSKLSKILGEVAHGEEVIVTDHNRPVAKITSVSGVAQLPSSFDLRSFLKLPSLKLRTGAISNVEMVRKLRDE